MSYTALYRKFRPDSFQDVKGQDAIVRTLKIRSGHSVSDMPICSAVPEEQVKRRWQRSLQRR